MIWQSFVRQIAMSGVEFFVKQIQSRLIALGIHCRNCIREMLLGKAQKKTCRL